ncbi:MULTISPECIES: transcriptional regulator [Paraburkholderia]|uniref:transcriptional regulator n=1 Tax=Paraburkholderia TaxID=1822464 RepID=UPI0009DEAF70|nr:transcriptional regulator [Paraburkholderia mimosarum]
MNVDYHVEIRAECLRPADEGWEQPRGAEVQELVRRIGLSGRALARVLGLSKHGGRQVRRWISGETPIPYIAWAILCDMAGFGTIWRGKSLDAASSGTAEADEAEDSEE